MPIFVIACVACGGSAPAKAPAPASASQHDTPISSDAPEPASTSSPTAMPGALPSACVDPSSNVCTPPNRFVERVCDKPHQDVALALLRGGTPFTRLYLRGRLDELLFDEEVLALRFHAPSKTGMVVGNGTGTYDVLRWDGSCANGVEAEAVTRSRPPNPRSARVKWHRISPSLQDSIVASSEDVKRAHAKRGKECRGAMTGEVSAACEKADAALAHAVVEYLRNGGTMPLVEF